jgi:hypothetical protein
MECGGKRSATPLSDARASSKAVSPLRSATAVQNNSHVRRRIKILSGWIATAAWSGEALANTKIRPDAEARWAGFVGFLITVLLFALLVWWAYRPRK